MTVEHSRLGRGLGALLAARPPARGADPLDPARPAYREVPVGAVIPNPRQPRTIFEDDGLDSLVASIRDVGLLQPVVVRPGAGSDYEIVMGERRWRAARQAGLATIPVIVRETGDDDMLRDALLENLHREQLNSLDEAAAYAQLLEDFGATHEQLAARVGRSRAHISNTLRLLGLPPPVQRRVAAGVLSAGHARALLAIADPTRQEEIAGRIVAEGLSVRAVEEIAATDPDIAPARVRGARVRRHVTELALVAERLTDALETGVRVEAGRRKGRVVIEFASLDDLDRILGRVELAAQAALRAARGLHPAASPPLE